MSTFMITTEEGLEPEDIRDAIQARMHTPPDGVAVEQIEVIHEPEAAGREGQVGLIYRVVGVA